MPEDNNDHFHVWFFLLAFAAVMFAAIARENFIDNPVPTKATSSAPAISLRCRDGLFFFENAVSGKAVPVMDFDSRGVERQVPCTKAYEAIKMRKAMGRQ